MRAAWVIVLSVVGCTGEPRFVAKPLPPLVVPQSPKQHELAVPELVLIRGEHLIWDVHLRGFTIGRAELSVDDQEVTSRFRTSMLASTVASIEHDLVTTLDRGAGRAHSAIERIVLDGKVRQFTTEFAGTTAHSFHTALGLVRAWAQPEARAGFLHIVHADQTFRLELSQPVVQQDTLRVEGRVISADADPISLTIWLDAARVPIRIEIRADSERLTAELI